MVKKIDLIAKLIITYIVILAFCFLLYVLVVLPTTGAEKVNAIIGLLGWSATLFAPVAAFILINNWKEQIKHEKALECLTGIYNEISQFHFTIFYLKNSNKPDEIKRNFNSMDLKDFINYSKEIFIEFEEIQQSISKIYNNLGTLTSQYKLIFETEDERFEYILDHYFKIYWTLLKLISDYLKFYTSAKQLNQEIEIYQDHELFKVREMQLQYNKDPTTQRNSDGSYIFMSSLYLAEIKKNSLIILRNIRKDL
ncbi:hypothetical protein A1Z75_RS08465 [Acinetobacter baumannii]|nr:hypothetical protein [Acinetobacter baumannii]